LEGFSAFVRDSYGYTASQVNLSSLAGGSFSYGFGIGTDSVINDIGWFVDDVRIYTCSTCQTSRVLTNAHSGTAALYQASNTITAGSGFTVGVDESVRFEAGTSVAMQPGFSISGGTFAVSTTSSCP
jgi:bacillolysin